MILKTVFEFSELCLVISDSSKFGFDNNLDKAVIIFV
jgi:hypothetical protein